MDQGQEKKQNIKRRTFLGAGIALMAGGGVLAYQNLTEQQKFEASGTKEYATSTGDETGEYQKNTEITTDPIPLGEAEEPTVEPPAYTENPAYTQNFESDAYGEPIGVSTPENSAATTAEVPAISDIDLAGISAGGGAGHDSIVWETMPRNTLRSPAVQLNMPIVPKSKKLISRRQEGNTIIEDYAIDVPVSFQCGWLNTSAPLTAAQGTSVLTGHVNYVNGNFAPMSAIKLLGAGDIVLTTDDAGVLSRWAVTKTYTVNQSDFSRISNSTDLAGARRLILVTCELDSNGTYSKNYAVEANPA